MDNTKIGENKEPITQIIQGSDKVVDRFVQFMQNAQRRIIIITAKRTISNFLFSGSSVFSFC
jgi:hypothetical protein